MSVTKIRYAMISTWIRRDLHDPLRLFDEIEILHYYQYGIHKDITASEVSDAFRYTNPLQLYRQLRRTTPDMIQGVEPFALKTIPYLLAGWLYVRRHKLPLVVVSPENRPIAIKYNRMVATILKVLLKPYLRQADLVIYLNEGAKDNFLQFGASQDQLARLMYGTWGVNVDEFRPDAADRFDFGFGKTILYVGRLDRIKGLFHLLDAFAIISPNTPGVGLVFIGAGPDEDALRRRVAELHLSEKTRFLGPVLNRDLPAYFRGAELFVSPSVTTKSWEEQIGMTNIQAMACGVPVVSTLSGAIPEYVINGKTGLLVPEKEPKALADAILQLLNQPERTRKMAANARACALKRYDACRNVVEVEDALVAAYRNKTEKQ